MQHIQPDIDEDDSAAGVLSCGKGSQGRVARGRFSELGTDGGHDVPACFRCDEQEDGQVDYRYACGNAQPCRQAGQVGNQLTRQGTSLSMNFRRRLSENVQQRVVLTTAAQFTRRVITAFATTVCRDGS